jgi:hypothetical protein
VYDTFSPDLRGVSEDSFTSTENGTSLSAHGAQVAPSGRPRGGAVTRWEVTHRGR